MNVTLARADLDGHDQLAALVAPQRSGLSLTAHVNLDKVQESER
ncbi:hypothetical protein [Sphingomonas phyllosphaerae]|nr:hypothetical protein [Sphingomonas phyllosphaerae]